MVGDFLFVLNSNFECVQKGGLMVLLSHISMASLFKNTSFMLAASIGQKVISLVYFALVARLLGPEQTGLYTSVLATTTIAVVFVDLGLTNVFIRDTARDPGRLPIALGNMLTVKLVTGLLSYFGLLLAVHWSGFGPDFLVLAAVSGFTMLFDSLHLTLYGALRVRGELKYEAVGMVGSQIVTLVVGGVALWLWRGPVMLLLIGFLVASIANAIYAWYQLHRVGVAIKWRWPGSHFKGLVIAVIPFALAAIFNRIYSYLDVLMLNRLAGNAATALYSTPSKITFAFQFIPLALVAALYPRLSEFYHTNKAKCAQAFTDSFVYLTLIALPVTLGLYWLAEPLTLFLFGENYRGAIIPLQILGLSLVWAFASFPVGALLNASNCQTRQTTLTGVVLVINAGLNWYFIPHFGAVAAAWATLIGNVVLTVGGYVLLPGDATIKHGAILLALLKIVFAGTAMSVVLYVLRSQLHFMVAGVIGAAIYALFIVGLRVIAVNHWQQLFNKLSRRSIPPTV